MKRLWKFVPVLFLFIVIALIWLPQYPSQSQSIWQIERVIPAVPVDRSDGDHIANSDVVIALEEQTVFLPLVIKSSTEPTLPGIDIYGTVNANGEPVDGIILSLWRDDGEHTAVLTTTTGTDGTYTFVGLPSLLLGDTYYAVYQNEVFGPNSNPDLLYYYVTPSIETYTAGTNVHLSDFDIGDIPLISPGDYITVTTPVTFTWETRAEVPTDKYYHWVLNNQDFEYVYSSPELDDSGSFTLESLIPGKIIIGPLYHWEVWVYNDDGGLGISYDTHGVYFTY